jgi:hypothetical protein
MKSKLKKILLLLVVCFITWVVFFHLKYRENTTIYISSQKSQIDLNEVNLFIDGKLKDTLNIKEYYDLNMYVYKDDFSIGKHSIELKTLDGESYLKENFFYLGLVNWTVISCFDKKDYSFHTYFTKPILL